MSGLANKRRFAWRAVFFPLPSHLLLRYLQLIRSAPTRKRCRRSDETPNHARGCVKSRPRWKNRSKSTIETLSEKIKTIYRSSSCVGFFSLGLFTQPRAAANPAIAPWLQSTRPVGRVSRRRGIESLGGRGDSWFFVYLN